MKTETLEPTKSTSWHGHSKHALAHIPAPTTIRFWGVRGGIPCPGADTARYGGNTSCVEIRISDQLFIFDAGTGLRLLGNELARRGKPIDADIFFTHFHLDHILGLPFFAPCYFPNNTFRFWSGSNSRTLSTKESLSTMMRDPLFPVGLNEFRAQIEFRDFTPGEILTPRKNISVRTASLNHPGGSTGYRLEFGNTSIAYITDTEHKPGQLDANVLMLADNVDVMIYDANYTDLEFPQHIGWGHSTWEQAIRLANEANVKELILFHHDPRHSDDMLDEISAQAAKLRIHTSVAAEGMAIKL